MRLEAVLWDMDGTLVRTEELWLLSEERTMADFGSHWDAQDQAVAVGGPLDRVINYMATRVGRPEAEVADRIIAEIEELMRTSHIAWMPGARELHDEIAAADIPQGLVSNSWRELVDAALTDLNTAFEVVIAGDEVAHPKPDPEPYASACARLGARPEHTVVLEDSPTGVTAGLAAGCFVVAIPHIGGISPAPRLTVLDTLAGVSLAQLQAIVLDAR